MSCLRNSIVRREISQCIICVLFNNAKVIFMFFSTGRLEKKLVLESSLLAGSWGLLELYILLTDDIFELDMTPDDLDLYVYRRLRNCTVAIDVKHKDLLISLLIAKCPVSRSKSI